MNSNPADAALRGSALLPGSIVARTTVLIIMFALIVGTVFAVAGGWLIHRSEEQRLRAQLDELLSTVENTVSIACYVRDQALAREIGNGLMRNHVVSGVRIVADGVILQQQTRPGLDPHAGAQALAISRKIHSPFKAGETVGEIWLYAQEADISAQALLYTRFVVLVLALEVALVALGVAWVVYNLITRPIKGISDELHRLEVRGGVRLHVPDGNQQDEIGRLVADVNTMIAELSKLLDVERRLRIEHQVSERRLALIFEKVDAGIFEVDAAGRLHSWNPAFVRTLGQPAEPPSLRVMMSAQAQRLDELIARSLASGAPCEADFELHADQHSAQWVELSLTLVSDGMLQGVINDITERKRTEQAAQRLAVRDALTGQLNRRGLDLGLRAAFERRQGEPGLNIAIMLIDLDFFKQVNDTHGHDAGDIVLRHVSAVLEAAVRRTDLLARPGGDEFTVVLIGIDSPAKAEAIARQIIATLARPIDVGGGAEARIGASIGVAMVEDAAESPASALRRADEAMYAAKQAGRNAVRFAPAGEGRLSPVFSPMSS